MKLLSLVPVLLAGFALAGCEAARPIRLSPPVPRPAARAKEPVRVQRCEQPARARLSDPEKNRLFDDFDSWKEGRRAPGEAVEVPPAPAGSRAAVPACRVTRS